MYTVVRKPPRTFARRTSDTWSSYIQMGLQSSTSLTCMQNSLYSCGKSIGSSLRGALAGTLNSQPIWTVSSMRRLIRTSEVISCPLQKRIGDPSRSSRFAGDMRSSIARQYLSTRGRCCLLSSMSSSIVMP